MIILEAIRDFIATCPELENNSLFVSKFSEHPVNYSIDQLPGAKVLEAYIGGDKVKAFPFALNRVGSTADDIERLINLGFFEKFSDWLDQQTDLNNLPVLGPGKIAQSIEALDWGMLLQESESDTGQYQIQCQLIYEEYK